MIASMRQKNIGYLTYKKERGFYFMKKKLFIVVVLVFVGIIFSSSTVPYLVYAAEERNTNLELSGGIIENEDNDVYTLTKEDEKKIDQVVDEYLNQNNVPKNTGPLGIEPYGFGKKWWNSRDFVGKIIDAALTVIGIGGGFRTAKGVMQIIRANRKNITRIIEKHIAKKIGIGIGSIVSGALNIASTLSGKFSIGYFIAWGLDIADRRTDGYICA